MWHRTHMLLPGDSYMMRAGHLHETLTNDITVTIMKRSPPSKHIPRVLCPVDAAPDNVFTRYDLDDEKLWNIVLNSCYPNGWR